MSKEQALVMLVVTTLSAIGSGVFAMRSVKESERARLALRRLERLKSESSTESGHPLRPSQESRTGRQEES